MGFPGPPAGVHLAAVRGWLPASFDLPAAALPQACVPSLFDLAVGLPSLALQLVFFLVARRPRSDWLASTEVVRAPAAARQARQALLVLAGGRGPGVGPEGHGVQGRGLAAVPPGLCHSMRSTAPYVTFLEQGHPAPAEYILGLFALHDVVVLCERYHPVATQWDLICQVVSDPRFADRVGHVFIECGSVAMQAPFDSLMATDGLSPAEANRRIVGVLHGMTVWPTWTSTNFYTYLTRLYTLNQYLPRNRRIRHHFTDAAVDWAALTTPQAYQAYQQTLVGPDHYMTQSVIDQLPRLGPPPAGGPPKCLVVMNYRHAFALTGSRSTGEPENTYEYLERALGDRAAKVLLNTASFGVPVAQGAVGRGL